ncbi:F-box protein: endocytic membrane traffic, recycling ReCYcling 1 [Tulasnella sp. 403]|nr:F-box protein: endocytic membrane traffic, recycling ReCYcling 1 [Tulasnella sp. 403]
MDKWVTLEPVRLHTSGLASAPKTSGPTSATARLLGRTPRPKIPTQPYIGPLPVDIHVLIVSYLPITSIPAYARASRSTSALVLDERVWKIRWSSLGIERHGFQPVLDHLQQQQDAQTQGKLASGPAMINVVEQDVIDDSDDFGAFASASTRSVPSNNVFDMGGLVTTPRVTSGFPQIVSTPKATNKTVYKDRYIRAHTLLKPLLSALLQPPHVILPTLFPSTSNSDLTGNGLPPPQTLRYQAQVLHLLTLFLSPALQPVLAWPSLRSSLRAAIDRFEATLLSAFDSADSRGEENGMKDAAWASWEVFEGNVSVSPSSFLGGGSAEWEMGKVWAEKKEIFYEGGKWDPISNFTPTGGLDFRPMDDFMTHILNAIRTDGATAVRVFPPASGVLRAFADRLAIEVVGEYISPLLTHARGISNDIFLRATAASFVQAWKIVDLVMEVAATTRETPKTQTADSLVPVVTRHQAEDVVFRMFEPNMDEYLDEEVESIKQSLETICKEWEKQASKDVLETPRLMLPLNAHSQTSSADSPTRAQGDQARFLSSKNPAQVKRNVLASFTDVLLLPVTIVPRTVGAVVEGARSGATAAATGISMLNPQRWGSMSGIGGAGKSEASAYGMAGDEYKGGAAIFEIGDEDEEDEKQTTSGSSMKRESVRSSVGSSLAPPSSTGSLNVSTDNSRATSPTPSTISASSRSKGPDGSFDRLQLLLSLDIALELIHADRESLKRVETFQRYPGSYGHKVRETIEELFILMLQVMGDRHIQPGFAKAIDQMQTYKPAEHEETASVAPLMQFFELVHVADTIQSMVQVFFDKELAPHIDRTDFLNGVVREKKRFENTLDESVAAGLNTGTDLLMKQVEHIILVRTGPREYYPVEGAPMELKPTKGCTEAIACLEKHCKLLKGSTSKEVLEVFYQEVGIRLDAIIQKHLKRQIISLQGGFQVIADLNAYHAFIASLKVPQITADFANLKMLGHVFIVEDAKDLAQIVRDVTRYGGSFRPEDVYEFIQRRSDWKKIERTVDQTMYSLSFKEDCIIC